MNEHSPEAVRLKELMDAQDAESAEHARQRADRAHVSGFDVSSTRATDHIAAAREALDAVRVVDGRARLTNAQQLELAGVHASLAVAEALRTANAISALRLGVPGLEHDGALSADPKTTGRIAARNKLRRTARNGLGL